MTRNSAAIPQPTANRRLWPAVLAGLVFLSAAAGCATVPDLPGYASTPSPETLAAPYPVLAPQEVFSTELAQSSSGFDPAQAETQALLARAAVLRATGRQMMTP